MPVYNGEEYLEETIKSMLKQTLKDFELIIVNDASTDSTLEIAKRYAKKDKRVKVHTNKQNMHIGKSLNVGISLAKSPLIARMDVDDESLPVRLEKQYEFVKNHPEVGVVGCSIIIMDEEGREYDRRTYEADSEKLKKNMFKYSPFAHPTTMYRKTAFDEAGGYDPKMSPTEDLDLWFRIGKKWEFANIDEYLFKYRVFRESHSNKKLRDTELKVMKIRWKAIFKYGYKPRLIDIPYNLIQFVTIFIMPIRMRYSLFNYLRNRGLL